jgi:hypothetical protein
MARLNTKEVIMPLLLGKLVVVVAATTVAVSIAYALGSIMAAVNEADERAQRGSQAAA